jgi:hypothetical protein
MDILYSVIERETERCIPKKLRRTSSKPIWMNKNIMRLIRKKRRAWRNYSTHEYYRGDYQSWQAYKKVQDDIKKAVRLAKRKLERSLAKNAKKNPKAFYSYLKKKVSNKVSVVPLKEGDQLVTDEGRMAEMLNTFFCSVFTQEDLDELPQPEQLYHGEELFSSVTFDQQTVQKKLENLKPSSTPGPDGVWPRVLQKLASSLAMPLALIFTKLFQEGSVPSIWKQANVTPIFKKGVKGNPGNYRPVSLTCVICKIMESLIRDQLVLHLAWIHVWQVNPHQLT